MQTHSRSLVLTAVMASSGLAVILSTARPAPAYPEYLVRWQNTYPNSPTDDNVIGGLGQGCAVCHFYAGGGSPWNPYGWEIRRNLHAGHPIDDAILRAGSFDSDANPASWSNSTEVGAGTQPGWTPGPNNSYYYSDGSGASGLNAPPGILGSLDPSSSPMAYLCIPGTAGVIDCPCGNPAIGNNRGCDNSSLTYGAALTATGTASLGGDTLVFATGGQDPDGLCLLVQGTASIAAGRVFGQGVRCVGGSLKRLYTRTASAGSIRVPDLAAGEPSVSARSAEKGDAILPGDSRWYLVYYRDPLVLGTCPLDSTFNATETGQVDWLP